jgi:serine/threonine protein kinase
MQAYYEIYKNKIAHRDLKPENIFINDSTYKIGDFGFSKILDSQESLMSTHCGSLCYKGIQLLQKYFQLPKLSSKIYIP